jgi:hypothetical protein
MTPLRSLLSLKFGLKFQIGLGVSGTPLLARTPFRL